MCPEGGYWSPQGSHTPRPVITLALLPPGPTPSTHAPAGARLGRAIFVNPPWVFKLIWKVIEPFVDEVTRRKIVFHSGPLEGLQEYFESGALFQKGGGGLIDCDGVLSPGVLSPAGVLSPGVAVSGKGSAAIWSFVSDSGPARLAIGPADQLASTHGGTRNCSFEALISLFEADAESAGVGGSSAPEHAGDDFEPPPAYETLSPATTSTADALSVPDDGASVSAERLNSSQGRRRRRHRRRRPSTSRRLREAAEQGASKRLEGVAEEGTGGAAKGRPALRRDESSQSHTWWSDSDTDDEGKTAPVVVVIEPESNDDDDDDDDDAFVSAES